MQLFVLEHLSKPIGLVLLANQLRVEVAFWHPVRFFELFDHLFEVFGPQVVVFLTFCHPHGSLVLTKLFLVDGLRGLDRSDLSVAVLDLF